MSSHIPPKIKAKTKGGQSFFIEVEDDSAEGVAADGSGGVDESLLPRGTAQGEEVLRADLFARAVEVIKEVSQDVSSSLLDTDPSPSEVQLSLDLGFDASGSIWILKSSAKASMRLTLRWTLPQDKPAEDG